MPPFSHGIPSMSSSSHFNIQPPQQQMSHKYDQQFHQRSDDMIHSSYHHNMARLNIASPLVHQSTQSPLSHSPQSLSTMSQSASIYSYDPTSISNYHPSTSSNETYQFNNYASGNSGKNLLDL